MIENYGKVLLLPLKLFDIVYEKSPDSFIGWTNEKLALYGTEIIWNSFCLVTQSNKRFPFVIKYAMDLLKFIAGAQTHHIHLHS